MTDLSSATSTKYALLRLIKLQTEIYLMTTLNTATASVFVTTYGVGNEQGFATGKWFDLTDFDDKDEFIDAATEYAQEVLGDDDPELCFADFEAGFNTRNLISECSISDQVWEILTLNAHEMKLLFIYAEWQGERITDAHDMLERAQGLYAGQWDSEEDYASDRLSETGYLENLPDIIRYNLDMEGIADWFMQDMYHEDGYFFFNS
ncbi:antirestriction protein [Shewanella phage vB_SbaS_Y11]|nr:antirestriction protein [Shewanella phage vB_SbaS_Y11]